ncbi:chorismate--pyruvate lyase family protein [Alteromonas sp. BMJM2]|uniref:chorismate--pyruvate lyase family protein n=1 Tax=Alteromonas sp. BMJM2 TaxID=2954241 RepID=UPI0022B3088C|nr:chorismate lyase [Alteromonas sp. BMJM2]
MSLIADFPIGLAVDWLSLAEVNIPEPRLKNWLLDTGSLTERVQSACGEFSLQLLGQQTLEPHSTELPLLQANGQTTYQIREIVLCGDEQPWVFARSVIPQAVIDAELSNLGSEPLGKRLFNDKRFVRSEFQVCTLPYAQFPQHLAEQSSSQLSTQLKNNTKQNLWGRRSVFTFGSHHLIVAEVFLPGSPAYGQNNLQK